MIALGLNFEEMGTDSVLTFKGNGSATGFPSYIV